jgi:hypothetical protein
VEQQRENNSNSMGPLPPKMPSRKMGVRALSPSPPKKMIQQVPKQQQQQQQHARHAIQGANNQRRSPRDGLS